MPGGDGTGPFGQGPMTGRAGGFCAGFDMPGYVNHLPGRGVWGGGRGRCRGGGGRGWRHWYHAIGLTGWQRGQRGRLYGYYPGPVPPGDMPTSTPEQETSALQAQLRSLEETAERVKQRIQELTAGFQAQANA